MCALVHVSTLESCVRVADRDGLSFACPFVVIVDVRGGARLSSDSCARPPSALSSSCAHARVARARTPARGTATRRAGRGAGMGAPAGASHTTRDGPVGVCSVLLLFVCICISCAEISSVLVRVSLLRGACAPLRRDRVVDSCLSCVAVLRSQSSIKQNALQNSHGGLT